jgi:hypothetical protein
VNFYLYALASGLGGTEVPLLTSRGVTGLTGVLGEAVECLDIDGIVAAGGWIARTPEVARDTLFAQDRVVRDLHARAAALLPMRFGSSLDDERSVREFVERRRIVLQEQLALVKGREQMTLRIFNETDGGTEGGTEGGTLVPPVGAAKAAPSTPAHGPSTVAREQSPVRAEVDAAGLQGPGARYLAQRAAREVPPALRGFVERLQPYQRAIRVQSHHHPELVATIYHLIDRRTADVYRVAVEDAVREERLNVRISGPSPAYAFARLP